MTYEQAINFLYSQLPMFSRMGSAAFKKDLTNTLLLCEQLGNPQNQFKSIHIGGTNGKGSVSHMLAALLQTAGYKTGLYTSPHLYDFRERIKVNGGMAEKDFVVEFVEKMMPAMEAIQPSFFELTVAMAFEYFARQKVDVAVIEVGLGGRLDSTNVITPELSVITNIGPDHQNILGNTLQEIAGEKAGIMKKGIPTVVGERQVELQKIFDDKARANNSFLSYASDHYTVEDFNWENSFLHVEVTDKKKHQSSSLVLDLPGIYQTKNICTVLEAVDVLNSHTGFVIPHAHLKTVLAQVKKLTGLHGRWEIIHHKPMVVLEVAHNRDGMLQMLQHISRLEYSALHLVVGMVKDKDIDSVLSLFPREAIYYFTQSHIPRALNAASLKHKAADYGLKGEIYADVNTALNAARAVASQEDLIIVCGSIFLVAEVDRTQG